jgi:hypothetical protein
MKLIHAAVAVGEEGVKGEAVEGESPAPSATAHTKSKSKGKEKENAVEEDGAGEDEDEGEDEGEDGAIATSSFKPSQLSPLYFATYGFMLNVSQSHQPAISASSFSFSPFFVDLLSLSLPDARLRARQEPAPCQPLSRCRLHPAFDVAQNGQPSASNRSGSSVFLYLLHCRC